MVFIRYWLFYKLNRQYKLSNQKTKEWLLDQVKSFFLNLILRYLTARLFVFLVDWWPEYWYILFSIIGTVFILLLTFFLPKVLLPLFFKLKVYPDNSLRERLMDLIKRAKLKIEEIYEINLSSKFNFANAAVIGLGKTRKIILADNLTDKYSDAEVEAILAHELGHQKHKDMLKNILIQIIFLLILTFIISLVWPRLVVLRDYESITSIYGLPLLFVLWSFLSYLLSPILLYLNRKYETKADQYAVNLINDPKNLASALAKLADESLAEIDLSLYKLIFEASHPPINVRIQQTINDNN